jgi:hypothetical protein
VAARVKPSQRDAFAGDRLAVIYEFDPSQGFDVYLESAGISMWSVHRKRALEAYFASPA